MVYWYLLFPISYGDLELVPQARLRLRPFGTRVTADLAGWLLPQASENDRLVYLAELAMEERRRRRIIAPPPRTLERPCVEV